jgi:hypothetical protein
MNKQKLTVLTQDIIAKNKSEDIEVFIADITKKIEKKSYQNLIDSITLGSISYEFWKSGNKIQMIKSVLPGIKTSEKDEIKILTKIEAAQELLKLKLSFLKNKR